MAYELPKLNYEYDALEPHLDALTMEIHHSKHHAAYTANLNAAIEGTDMSEKTIEELLIEHQDNPAVRNNGGGFWNQFSSILHKKIIKKSCNPKTNLGHRIGLDNS